MASGILLQNYVFLSMVNFYDFKMYLHTYILSNRWHAIRCGNARLMHDSRFFITNIVPMKVHYLLSYPSVKKSAKFSKEGVNKL